MFDYVIKGGGCAGLSLAYQLEKEQKLKNKTLAIIEPRSSYHRDKTWSFWKIGPHDFEDCIIKSWNEFSISTKNENQNYKCSIFPYQTINSELLYKKILKILKKNKNIKFFKPDEKFNMTNSIIFNSIPPRNDEKENLWQHFMGIEIETTKPYFNEKKVILMDFNCEQRNSTHFFYILPFSKHKALIESTWISKLNKNLQDYENQIENYIHDNLNIKKYSVSFKEQGSIPLFRSHLKFEQNEIPIGTPGEMTRLSTGYTFLNIQNQSKYIVKNLKNKKRLNLFRIPPKYNFYDNVFLKVLSKNPNKMPNIFFNVFKYTPETAIKFLSNKSSFIEDIAIIMKMPKLEFIKALIN